MKKFSLWILIAAVLLQTVSCTTGEKDDPDTGTAAVQIQTQGEAAYYTKSDLKFGEGITHYAGNLTRQGNMLYSLGYTAGESEATAILAAMDLTTGAVTQETLPEATFINVSGFTVTENGCYVLKNTYDAKTDTDSYNIHLIRNGELVSKTPLDNYITISENYWGNRSIVSSGNTVCIGASNQLAVLSGDEVFKHTLPGDLVSLCTAESGEIYVIGKNYFCIYDPATGKFTEDEEKSAEITALGGNAYYTGPGYDLYYSTENGLYGCNFGTNSASPVLNWISSGLFYSRLDSVTIIDPSEIIVYCATEQYGSQKLMKLEQFEGELPERQVITVSYIEDGRGTIPNAAIKFNASQVEYEVICEEYVSSKGGDYAAAMDQLVGDILTGELADVLILGDKEEVDKYGSQGLLADLYTLMEDKNDYFSCIREYCETDGRLYGIAGEFDVNTLVIRTENLPEYDIWNSTAFLDTVDSRKDGQSIFRYYSREVEERWVLSSLIWEFIDPESASCSFETEEFVRVLNFMKSLPEEWTEAFEDGKNHYITDEILFMKENTSSFSQFLRVRALFGPETPIQYVGFPSGDGGAATITPISFYGISANSGNKDGAWAFVEYLLSGDVIVNVHKGMQHFPASKATYETWKESEGQLYYFFPYDEPDGYMTDIKPFENSDEGYQVQADDALYQEISDWLDGLKPAKTMPAAISDIIKEELSVFYSGTRSAEDTARIIQSRVSIYLSETK